jgi:hypothetical protein
MLVVAGATGAAKWRAGVLVLADFQRLACGKLKLGAINSVKEL